MSQQTVVPLFDAQTIAQAVSRLGRRISDEIGGEDPLIVSLLGGSVVFLADLIRSIERQVRFEFIHVGYSSEHTDSGDVMGIHYPMPIDIRDQSILLLKDVVASGVIETYLASQFRQRGARGVRFAALIDMPEERKTNFNVDYAAFSVSREGTLVGYGMKHQGRLGNLPFIGRFAEEA
jgi:hypoxanthine phosphoribosyltransferase